MGFLTNFTFKVKYPEIKEHFAYCMDNGLLFGEQEERLLNELYGQAERVRRLEDHVYSYKELMDGLHSFALKNIKRDISHLGRPITDIVISHTEQLQEQNKRYQEALKFYADKTSYGDKSIDFPSVYHDEGKKARQALEEVNE